MRFICCVGFIGGSVLSRLLQHTDAKSFEIVALVRSNDKVQKLNSFGVKTVLGDNANYEVLTKSASEADIVIAMVGILAEILEGCNSIVHRPTLMIYPLPTRFSLD